MAHINKDRIKETTTTTGTGPFTVAGAMTGHKAFSSVCAVGDTFRGVIQAVDASGAPTGEWQAGTFTYSALNQITTLTVEWSSTGSAVSFSAGTKQIWIGMTAEQAGWIRERLTANRTYYVRTNGSDNNTGLADTAGGAFLTIQKAINNASANLDTAGYTVTIQLGDGTYAENVIGKPVLGNGDVVIQGNSSTPDNVLVQPASGICFAFTAVPTGYTLKNMKLDATTIALRASGGSTRVSFSGLNFAATTNEHIYAINGAAITAIGDYSITGSASSHMRSLYDGYIESASRTITITGTPAFSTAFATTSTGSLSLFGNTFSGSATGAKYLATLNGVINTGGATLPGSVAGSTATGGQYA